MGKLMNKEVKSLSQSLTAMTSSARMESHAICLVTTTYTTTQKSAPLISLGKSEDLETHSHLGPTDKSPKATFPWRQGNFSSVCHSPHCSWGLRGLALLKPQHSWIHQWGTRDRYFTCALPRLSQMSGNPLSGHEAPVGEKASYKGNLDQMFVCATGLDGGRVECQDNCW